MIDAPLETLKQRELIFSVDPPGQLGRAFNLLSGLDDLKIELGDRPTSLRVTYSLLDYSLESLELALVKEGFVLDDAALYQIGKKLTYYLEEIEFHNLNVPEWRAKNRKSEVFVKAYEHHLHGDHDDTPPELREYR
jgi:hypothetical protein